MVLLGVDIGIGLTGHHTLSLPQNMGWFINTNSKHSDFLCVAMVNSISIIIDVMSDP